MAQQGGAWKVAYADFVTAMMAFFLVMWIGAQDQKVKRSIASYFQNPGAEPGHGSPSTAMGSLFNVSDSGVLPDKQSIKMGRGRSSYVDKGRRGGATEAVRGFLERDAEAGRYWKEQAALRREEASGLKDVTERSEPLEDVAARRLARQLEDELSRQIDPDMPALYQSLLNQTAANVDWMDVAEELLQRTAPAP